MYKIKVFRFLNRFFFCIVSLLLSHSLSFSFPGPFTLFLVPLVFYHFCRSIEFPDDDDSNSSTDKHIKCLLSFKYMYACTCVCVSVCVHSTSTKINGIKKNLQEEDHPLLLHVSLVANYFYIKFTFDLLYVL